MVGERSFRYVVPYAPVIQAAFTARGWVDTLVVGPDTEWQVQVTINLAVVIATGRTPGNRAPRSKMPPVVNVIFGCNNTIVIPVLDPDGDTVRCRWAEAAAGECGGVCGGFPGATLDRDSCTIGYVDVGQRG